MFVTLRMVDGRDVVDVSYNVDHIVCVERRVIDGKPWICSVITLSTGESLFCAESRYDVESRCNHALRS